MVETAGKIGLAFCEPCRIEPFEPGCETGEADEVRTISRGRDDEAAARCRSGYDLRPIGESLAAPFEYERLGALNLAPGRKHAAGKIRTAEAGPGRALDNLDRLPSQGEFMRYGEAGDAGADDADLHAPIRSMRPKLAGKD